MGATAAAATSTAAALGKFAVVSTLQASAAKSRGLPAKAPRPGMPSLLRRHAVVNNEAGAARRREVLSAAAAALVWPSVARIAHAAEDSPAAAAPLVDVAPQTPMDVAPQSPVTPVTETSPAPAPAAETTTTTTTTSETPTAPPQPVPSPPEKQKAPTEKAPDTTVTKRVFFDLSLCPTATVEDRTLGSQTIQCTDGEPLGRIVIGLYGRVAPNTVENFVNLCTGRSGSTYKGTIVHRIIPGQYIQAGKQGRKRMGQVESPSGQGSNPDILSPQAYKLPHRRPGTVSLALSVNDDEDSTILEGGYRNTGFLITTGPGPVPSLDGQNIVFGTVLEGMDVVTQIAAVPVFLPNEKIRQFNEFASILGDNRAEQARKSWYRPLKAVVISNCGLLEPPQTYVPTLP
eukprot:jgi/Chlat1/8197/Chrsp76S07661